MRAGILQQARDAAREESVQIEAEGQKRAEELSAMARKNQQQAVTAALSFLGRLG